MLTGFLPNSLTFPGFSQPEMNYSVHTFFLSLNSRSFKEIQGEKLHNFSEIFLMMYHSSSPPPPPPPPPPRHLKDLIDEAGQAILSCDYNQEKKGWDQTNYSLYGIFDQG